MPVCARCGQENPEGARFCNDCAAPLTAEQSTIREERKVVTILFADLVGFTGQAERVDPEDVRAGRLDRRRQRARVAVRRRAGRC